MVTMRVSRVVSVMLLASSAAWAQSQPCSTHGSLSDCEGQLCENDMQYCVWNVAAGSCGCPTSCAEYSGLNLELCVNSVCPSLLPQQQVPCQYDQSTQQCSCPQAAPTPVPQPTPVPLPQGCGKHSTRNTCEGDLCANDVQYCVWNVAAGSCGCPESCTEYSGLNLELCVNSACPSLLPQQHVPCQYDHDTQKCWCPEAAETAAPATPAPSTSAPPTSAPATGAPATSVPTTQAPELPPCNETTLVMNPSFELITTTTNIGQALVNGQMQSWSVSHGTPSVFGGAPGQGLRSAWMWSHSGIGEGIVTNVPFVSGQLYRVTMWVTTGNSVAGQFFVRAVNGLVLQTATSLPAFGPSDVMFSNGMVYPAWDEITFDYTATAAYAQLWIYPLLTGAPPNNVQAQVRVDNIRVCAIGTDAPATPAPATPAPATPAPPTPAPATSAPPTPAPATPLPPTPAPPVERCEDLNFQHKACVNTLCPAFVQIGKKVPCKYNELSGECFCPEKVETKAPATAAPVVERCEDLNFQHEACVNTLCPAFVQIGKKVACKYNELSGECFCPEKVETKAPATAAPQRCEDLNFQHKACVNTLCPGLLQLGKEVPCKYNELSGECFCPEQVETKAPVAVISDDCSSFHGSPRACLSSLCVVSGMKAGCKYDYTLGRCNCSA